MKLSIGRFSLDTTRQKASQDMVTHLPASNTGWWPILRESFAGAWQRGVTVPIEDALSHPTYWACVTLIAGDVAKIRPKLVEDLDGIDVEVERNSPYAPVLDRPNHYQNRIQFFTYWMMSKLMRGNAYALKERDSRGIVTSLYLLDPLRVRPMVSTSGFVFYACQQDLLAGLEEASFVIPASEIIHDIGFAPYHPLCGFSPVYAAGHAALQALTINQNATRQVKNGLQMGGLLTAPGMISDENAQALQEQWEKQYAGSENVGRVAVLGNGLKFEKMEIMSAVDAELIKQLQWDDEKICGVHHVPPYKVAVGPLPSYNNVDALSQDYYGTCLQYYFESLELCLTEGLEVDRAGYEVEFCVEDLDRMDTAQRMDVATKGVAGGVLKPNDARGRFNLPKVDGGDKVFLQKQCWPLEDLGSDAVAPAPVVAPALPMPEPMPAKALDEAELLALVLREVAA